MDNRAEDLEYEEQEKDRRDGILTNRVKVTSMFLSVFVLTASACCVANIVCAQQKITEETRDR